MEPFVTHKMQCFESHAQHPRTETLIGEEPLSIRIQGRPYSVIMRTAGDELAHVAGFCLGEGIVDTPEDIVSLAYCDDDGTNVVTVTLSESRKTAIPDHMERRQFVSQTSCGLCGKELVEELFQTIPSVNNPVTMTVEDALKKIERLSDLQPLRKKTRASHGAAIFNSNFDLLSVAEDVGRHNALDKAVGALFLNHRLKEAAVLVLSSRISYELVQKAARAQIPIVLAVSRPTSLAVSLSEKLNITLACLSRPRGLDVYCGAHRIIG